MSANNTTVSADVLVNVLEKIAENPEILDNLSMPNINFPTMGGEVMWNNLAVYKGWKIQQNTITHHCRIHDPQNVRIAWGGLAAMDKIFKRLAESN